MVRYIAALEGFDRECEAMRANIIMGEFMATESVGSSIKAGVQAAWEKLKKLVLQIWEKIKGLAKKIKNGVQALITMLHKSPNEADAGRHAREMSEWLKANNDLAETSLMLIDTILKDIDDLRALGKKLTKAERAELDDIEKTIEEALSKYEEAVKAEKAAQAEVDKADEACKAILQEDWDKNRDAESRYDAAYEVRDEARKKSNEAWAKSGRSAIDASNVGIKMFGRTSNAMKAHGIDVNKNNPLKSKQAEESFFSDSDLEPATEAEGGHKISLSGLKQKLANLLGRSQKASDASEQFVDEIKNEFESIKNSSSDEQTSNKKQRLLSKIMNLGTRMFNTVKSIPGKIKELFSRLWSFLRRGKSQVKSYNGPSPVAANDSYLFDPDLNLEIG